MATQGNVLIMGMSQRQPPLIMGLDSASGVNPLESPTFWGGTLGPLEDSEQFFLPVWSGRIQFDVTFIYTGTVSSIAWMNRNPSGFGPDIPIVPFIGTPASGGVSRYSVTADISGGRTYQVLQIIGGDGYTTLDYSVSVMFYGSEDT